MVQLGLGYVFSSTTPWAKSWLCFSSSYTTGKKFKGFTGKELDQSPALWHSSFWAWGKVGSHNTGWTWMRETGRVHQEAYVVSALAPVTAFPQNPLIRKRLQFGVIYWSLSATQHTIYTTPGSSSQTTKAAARKSMSLIENKLMLDTEHTGSGYLTTGQNQKDTTQKTTLALVQRQWK